MKNTCIIFSILCYICTGCFNGDFDADKVEELHFAHNTESDGKLIHYEWVIPADKLQPILRQMKPRGTQYNGVLVSGRQAGTLYYDGDCRRITWSRVKMAKSVLLLSFKGNRYILEEPHASEFYALLEKYKRSMPVADTPEHFLSDVPEFQAFYLNMTEAELNQAITHEQLGVHFTPIPEEERTSYVVWNPDGENVIIGFHKGICTGIQRRHKNPTINKDFQQPVAGYRREIAPQPDP